MIDVMMFLLVFFVLVSINVIPALGLHTTLPQSAAPDQLSLHKRVVVTLARDGTVELDGTTVDLPTLGRLLAARKTKGEKMDITINGDEGVTLQQLVSVFDVLKEGGFENVAIATKRRK